MNSGAIPRREKDGCCLMAQKRTPAEIEQVKRRENEAWEREETEKREFVLRARRRFCTRLRFHRYCPDRRCRRAQRCTGNPNDCLGLFWPLLPEDFKNEMRQAIHLVAKGMPPKQAAVEAQAFVAERKRLAKELARRSAPPLAKDRATADDAAPATPARVYGPRIRAL